MIDNEKIKQLLDEHNIGWQASTQAEHWLRIHEFARAVYALGRNSGLDELAKDLEKDLLFPVIDQWDSGYVSAQRSCIGQIQSLKEKK